MDCHLKILYLPHFKPVEMAPKDPHFIAFVIKRPPFWQPFNPKCMKMTPVYSDCHRKTPLFGIKSVTERPLLSQWQGHWYVPSKLECPPGPPHGVSKILYLPLILCACQILVILELNPKMACTGVASIASWKFCMFYHFQTTFLCNVGVCYKNEPKNLVPKIAPPPHFGSAKNCLSP